MSVAYVTAAVGPMWGGDHTLEGQIGVPGCPEWCLELGEGRRCSELSICIRSACSESLSQSCLPPDGDAWGGATDFRGL